MAFSGSLKFYSPFDLLESIGKQEKSGQLILRDGDVVANVYFQDGNIISATKTDVNLPKMLVITSSTPAGISIPRLQQKLQVIVQDIITDILDWDDGTYLFQADSPEEPEFHLFEAIPVMAIIYNSLRLLDEWERIKQTIHTFEAVLVPREDAPSIDELERKHRKVLGFIDGKRTVQVLIDGVNISKYELLDLLVELIGMGYVQYVEPENVTGFSVASERRQRDREEFRRKLADSEVSTSSSLELNPERIEEHLHRLMESAPETVLSPPNQIVITNLVKETVKLGMDFTLIRLVQLALQSLRKIESLERYKYADFIRQFTKNLIQVDKQQHVHEALNSYTYTITLERDDRVYEELLNALVDIEQELRTVSWGDELRKKIVLFLSEELQPKSKRPLRYKERLLEFLGNIPSRDAVEVFAHVICNEPELAPIARKHIVRQREHAAEPIISILKHAESKSTRLALIEVLKDIGDDALPYIKELRNDDRWYVRRNAAVILGGINRPMAANILDELLEDEKDQVREAAITAIAQHTRSNAERVLLKHLDDPNKKLRCLVIRTLGRVGSDYAAKYLSSLIIDRAYPLNDGDDEVLVEICIAMGKIGSNISLPALHRVIGHRRLLKNTSIGLVISAACDAVARIGSPSSLEVLREHNKTGHKAVRAAAERAYKKIKSFEAKTT